MSTVQDPMIFAGMSSIFSCVFLLIVIGIIMSIMKYSMAAIAVSKGDVGSAANIMNEGKRSYYQQPVYDPYYTQPVYPQSGYPQSVYPQPVYKTADVSKTNSILIITVIWCLIILGTSLYMYFSNKLSRDMKNSNKWRTTEGIVTFSGTISKNVSSTSRSRSSRKTTYTTQYAPDIGYDYTVDNAQYHGNLVYPNGGFTNVQSVAQQYANNKPIGKKIIVLYNVNNPNESYLEYDQGTSLISPVFSIICTTTVCGFLFYQCYALNNCLKASVRVN